MPRAERKKLAQKIDGLSSQDLQKLSIFLSGLEAGRPADATAATAENADETEEETPP